MSQKRKKFSKVGIMAVVVTVTFLWQTTYQKFKKEQEVQKMTGHLQPIPIKLLDNSVSLLNEIDLSNGLILVFIDTKCEVCYNEAISLQQNINSFEETSILLASEEPLKNLEMFCESAKLSSYNNVIFAHMDEEAIKKNYGDTKRPHIFVYGPTGVLIGEFIGETKLEAVQNVLRLSLDVSHHEKTKENF